MIYTMLNFCFVKSKQPVLFKDLLVANVQHNEKMPIDATKLGYRLKVGNTYTVYILLVILVSLPLILLSHGVFSKINSHVSILASIIFTAIVFIWFNFFKVWLEDKMASKVIQEAWKIHFPFFSYNDYRYKIEEIFHKAMKEEVQKKDLEKYVMDHIMQE